MRPKKIYRIAIITLVVTLIIHFRFFTPAKRQDDNSPDETISVLEKTIIPRQIARRGTEKLSGVEPLAGNFCFTIGNRSSFNFHGIIASFSCSFFTDILFTLLRTRYLSLLVLLMKEFIEKQILPRIFCYLWTAI